MTDHPLLGAALLAIGAVLIADAYYSLNVQSFSLGHIAAFNGVILVALGCNNTKRHATNATRTFPLGSFRKYLPEAAAYLARSPECGGSRHVSGSILRMIQGLQFQKGNSHE